MEWNIEQAKRIVQGQVFKFKVVEKQNDKMKIIKNKLLKSYVGSGNPILFEPDSNGDSDRIGLNTSFCLQTEFVQEGLPLFWVRIDFEFGINTYGSDSVTNLNHFVSCIIEFQSDPKAPKTNSKHLKLTQTRLTTNVPVGSDSDKIELPDSMEDNYLMYLKNKTDPI